MSKSISDEPHRSGDRLVHSACNTTHRVAYAARQAALHIFYTSCKMISKYINPPFPLSTEWRGDQGVRRVICAGSLISINNF